MNQLEIQFFWPLTEQIPLDLDFSQCPPHQYCTQYVMPDTPTWSSSLRIDSETITFNNLRMPWYRKVLFKLLGFKWGK